MPSSLIVLGMPHPGRISHDDILAAARRLLETDGPESVAMRALARELGVSAPSLYFHVSSREAVLDQLTEAGFAEFATVMQAAFACAGCVRTRLRAMSEGYVAFAEQNPQLFTLMFGPCGRDLGFGVVGLEAAEPVIRLATEIAGPEQGLTLAQALWSLVHGYTVLRLAGQFHLNDDHETAFERGVDMLLAGVAATAAAR